MTPPIIETDRLRLRGPGPQDEATFVAFQASERSRFVGGPMDPLKAWTILGLEIGHWTLRGFGMWAVTLKGSDDALGYVGCWRPNTWPENELGWILFSESHEGKGIAREAAEAARRFAYETLGWSTAVSYIAPGNARSIGLAKRLGCTLDAGAERPVFDEREPCLVYRHPAPEAAP